MADTRTWPEDHAECGKVVGHKIEKCCDTCHARWEHDGEYMCDGKDKDGKDLHTCCVAACRSQKKTGEHR